MVAHGGDPAGTMCASLSEALQGRPETRLIHATAALSIVQVLSSRFYHSGPPASLLRSCSAAILLLPGVGGLGLLAWGCWPGVGGLGVQASSPTFEGLGEGAGLGSLGMLGCTASEAG